MKFVNRVQEMQDLRGYFAQEPNALLFVYGPKSSGKSALLQKLVAELPPDRFVVNFMNLREVLIYDFNTFLDTFFPKTLYGKVKDVADGVTFNIGFFGLNVEDEKLVKQNPFKVMGDKLRAACARGKQPVIVLDEIQILKNIYVNSTRYLLDELFNLFVSLTKTGNVAHVVVATSDSYFIEELYNHAKLKKTMELYLIDHLSRAAVADWLAEEGLSASESELVWQHLGGCPWEIQQLLKGRGRYDTLEEACAFFVHDEYGKLVDYVFNMEPRKEKMLRTVIEKIVKDGDCHITDLPEKAAGAELLKEMVAHDFWFYRIDQQRILANSQSLYRAFEKLVGNP
jgi:uncharacterized protein